MGAYIRIVSTFYVVINLLQFVIAQDLDGKIIDQNNLPVQGAIVSVYSAADSSSMLFHTTTNKEGAYLVNLSVFPSVLSVRSMAHQQFKLTIKSKADFPKFIRLKDKSIEIDEVLVDMNRGFASLNSDTINYNLAALNLQGNDNLKEILNRIPGIQVDESYRIVHGGDEINKILVNGQEAFEHQNRIALENIEARMLDGISVVGEYQDPYQVSLAKENTEKIIDLTLKDEFSDMIKGNVEGGFGYSNKYIVKPFLFYFRPGWAVFTLGNFNNIFDKDWSSEDYAGALTLSNTNSRYFSGDQAKVFYEKDITLNQERSLLSSTTVRNNTKKYSFKGVFNFSKIQSLRLFELDTRYLGSPLIKKSSTDDLKARMWSYSVNWRHILSRNVILQLAHSNYVNRLKNNNENHLWYPRNNDVFELSEHDSERAHVISGRVGVEAKIGKGILVNSWEGRYENSKDGWNIDEIKNRPENSHSIEAQYIGFTDRDNKLKTSWRHGVGRNNTLEYSASYQKIEGDLKDEAIHYERSKTSIEAEGNIRHKHFNLKANFGYHMGNIMVGINEKRNYRFPSSNITWDVFLDRLKKNRIKLQVGQSSNFVSIRSAMRERVISYDRIQVGSSDFLLDVLDWKGASLSYVYDFPFKGQSFQFSLYTRNSSNAIVPQIDTEAPWRMILHKLKGLNRMGATVSYGQNVLTAIYPSNVRISLEKIHDKYYQIVSQQELPITQQDHRFSMEVNSFSDKAYNFTMKTIGNYSKIKYPQLETTHQSFISLVVGPRVNYKNIQIKPLFKFQKVEADELSNSFMDFDMLAYYQWTKRLELFLSLENFLQNVNLKPNDALAFHSNSQGLEYYQSFRNVIGYSVLGFKYRF